MVVRLTHGKKRDLTDYTYTVLPGSFSLTGVAAGVRATRKLVAPDKIPYLLQGQSATISKLPPVWGAAQTFSLTEGVASGPTALNVSVPGGGSPTIAVAWHSSSVPSTKPSWVTLTSGTAPTISFTTGSLDGEDVSSMVISATANGQTFNSSAGSITVNATGNVIYGTLVHDGPATPEQISLWLPGTYGTSATATVQYKRSTDSTYTTGHPMYRIQPSYSNTPAVGTVENGFAWPIIDLTPDTTYDIRVTLTDGGAPVTHGLQTTTRALPAAAGTPNKTANSAATIASQMAGLNPGDVLEIAAGTYSITSSLSVSRSGTIGSPIYIRGASRTGTVLTSSAVRTFFSLANGVSDVVIENMTIQGNGVDQDGATASSYTTIIGQSGGNVATRITLRNVTATGIDRGVYLYNGQGVLVYDNTLTGNNLWSSSPVNFMTTNRTWNDDGLNLAGKGNCGFNNYLKGFGDTLAYAQHVDNDVVTNGDCIHFYRNDIWNGCDDGVEVDHGSRNLTAYDNRLTNTMTALSLDPIYAGPMLYARNTIINPGCSFPFKFNSNGSGYFIYSNTFIGTRRAFRDDPDAAFDYTPQNGGTKRSFGLRNNVFVNQYTGITNNIWWDDNPGTFEPMDWTHNSFFPDKGFQIRTVGTWPTVAAAVAGAPTRTPVFGSLHSPNNKPFIADTVTTVDPFTTTITASLGATSATEVTTAYTPVASHSSLSNTGVVIPNITDGYSGAAPDRGAAIEGRSPVSYGDRSQAPAWFTALADKTWATPVSNWLGATGVKDPLASSTNAGSTGHQSIIIAWTGMGVDQARKTAFMLRNGGHGDYYGNEVYALDFRTTAPAWVRVKDASSNSGGTPQSGYPHSAHTYFEHSGNDGRWFSTHTGSGSPSGFADGNHAWEFNSDDSAWVDRGYIGNQASVGGGSSDYNPVTNQLVIFGNGSTPVKVYNCAGGAFTLAGSSTSFAGSFEIENMVAIDTTNNILLVQSNRGTQTYRSINLSNLAQGFSSFSVSGTRQSSYSQLVWHPASNAFLGWGGGNTLKKLSLTVDGTGRYSAGTFTDVALSGTAPTNQTQNGLYDKVNLVRDMGNGDAMLVVVPRYASPDVYVARIIGAV